MAAHHERGDREHPPTHWKTVSHQRLLQTGSVAIGLHSVPASHQGGLRYDPMVTRLLRNIAAAVLVVAVTSMPLLADWCAASCEAARQAGHAACHHSSTSLPHIGQEPVPCGHDHHPLVLIAASATSFVPRIPSSPFVDLITERSLNLRHLDGEANSRAPSRSSPPLPITLSAALRI